jgi:hypothetical protein
MGTVAHADILAAGAGYGGSNQAAAVCYVFNAGSTDVTILAARIFKQTGGTITLASNDCNILSPGETCGIGGNIANNIAHSCKITTSGSVLNVSGSLEFRSGSGVILNSLVLK